MGSANTHFSYEGINNLLLKITCLFWLAAKLISWRIWTTYRILPTAPIFQWLDRVPPLAHTLLFGLSIFLLCWQLFNKNRGALLCLLATEIFSCLLDQNRWQPWEYQCLFIVFIFISNNKRPALIMSCFVFVLASTYIYSGLHKLNYDFLQITWRQMILHSFFKVPFYVSAHRLIYFSGYLLGLAELLAGVGLLFHKTKKAASAALILMHLFILILIGPGGLNYNAVVWPWNIAMIFYLYFLFFKNIEGKAIFTGVFHGWNKLIFIFWGMLPALSFAGAWDSYLSSGLYSGKSPKMIISVRDTSKCLPLQPFCKTGGAKLSYGQATINLKDWSITETNVVAYPEVRVYKIMQQKLEKQYAEAGLKCTIFIRGAQP
ncbi:DoxX family membrane protein [Mucilaginibacter xinganensis]|uniref:HTTM domain-containing protein n=1 Tax=Mucilaginibacter xinganensis TaxID=1234841 RepID=A0A223NUI2_9SPHI|nr:DoxX family membrane protein [Mucilaginibacter xinganensis]ASU33288.1 hypothetical protein MuYL_1390 [Mucilaginibacter xinganensis]